MNVHIAQLLKNAYEIDAANPVIIVEESVKESVVVKESAHRRMLDNDLSLKSAHKEDGALEKFVRDHWRPIDSSHDHMGKTKMQRFQEASGMYHSNYDVPDEPYTVRHAHEAAVQEADLRAQEAAAKVYIPPKRSSPSDPHPQGSEIHEDYGRDPDKIKHWKKHMPLPPKDERKMRSVAHERFVDKHLVRKDAHQSKHKLMAL